MAIIIQSQSDGFSAASFHLKCDNKPNTLVIIKSQMGFIFGGYTEQSWQVLEPTETEDFKFKSDNKAFIFSLTNQESRPLLMKNEPKSHPYFSGISTGGGENGEILVSSVIRCESNLGPSFGGDFMLFGDIHICTNSNEQRSISNLGVNFKHPAYSYGDGRARTFLAGQFEFLTAEIEVYTKQ